MIEPYYADDAVTLHHGHCLDVLRALPDASVDAVVTDPPYGLGNTTPSQVAETVERWVSGERDYLPGGSGFMGKSWDAFVPPVATWDECLRVLKPGGHLLAFSGSRTFDLMTLGVRLAGFDIRDGIAWLYGSGFPKSLNVSEAMERWRNGERYEPMQPAIRPGVYDVTTYLRAARDKAGWTNRQIDALFGTNGMAGHWTSAATQPAVPSVRQWQVLKERLGFGDEVDDLVEQLGSTERPEGHGEGSTGDRAFLGSLQKNAEYESVSGWGTALKPAFEPVVVGRKPLAGTVAANILQYGTGALNIDGCRTGTSGGGNACPGGDECKCVTDGTTYSPTRHPVRREGDFGRWPTNVVLDESQAVALDKQSGVSASRRSVLTSKPGAIYANGAGLPSHTGEYGYDDFGGASRFFPTFRYEAKAPTSERPTYWAHDCDCEHDVPMRPGGSCLTCGTPGIKVAHPTVKPLDFMRWLVRLVTPPGGTVLEPFAGSGTTAEACVIEGFRCIAIEREADYLPLIVARLTKPIQAALDFGGAA